MFKIGSQSENIVSEMEKELKARSVENTYGFNKLAKAADYLNSAASIFEDANMPEVSDKITEILKNLANQLNSK